MMAGRIEYRNVGSRGPTMGGAVTAIARALTGAGGPGRIVERRDLEDEAAMRRIVKGIADETNAATAKAEDTHRAPQSEGQDLSRLVMEDAMSEGGMTPSDAAGYVEQVGKGKLKEVWSAINEAKTSGKNYWR